MAREKTYYDILGVTETASIEDIKKAYRNRAKKLHPDHNPGDESQIKALNKAHDVLSDDNKRKEYDREQTATKASAEAQEHAEQARAARARATAQAKAFGDQLRNQAGGKGQPGISSSPPPSSTAPPPKFQPPTPPSHSIPSRPKAEAATRRREEAEGIRRTVVIIACAVGAVLIFLISNSGSNRPPAQISQAYKIKVDYYQSLASMIRAAHVKRDENSPRITEKLLFPVVGGSTQVAVRLVHFTGGLKVDPDIAAGIGSDPEEYTQWLTSLSKLGYRPATLPELLAFSKQYPHIENGSDVVELGSLRPDPSDTVLGYAYCGISNGSLELHSTEENGFDELGYKYQFLAVRK